MYEYIEKMLEELPTNMEGLATTPVSSHLFNTDPAGCKKAKRRTRAVIPSPSGQTTIPKQMYETEHTNSSSLLMYQSKRARHRQLQKADKSNAIHKKYKVYNTNN